MKNTFRKKDNKALILVLTTTAVTAGTLAYLYLTQSGADTRKSIKHRIKDGAKEYASHFISKKTGISKEAIKRFADRIIS